MNVWCTGSIHRGELVSDLTLAVEGCEFEPKSENRSCRQNMFKVFFSPSKKVLKSTLSTISFY